MFEPIPEPSAASDWLRIKEGEKHRIRIMGTSKEPSSFIQGWEAWGDNNKPVRAPYVLGKPCPQSLKEISRKDEKPKLFWMFVVWHVDLDKPMLLSVTQQTIKTQILSYSNNKAWGDPANYILEIGRTGTGMETIYTVIAEPPIEAPSPQLLAAIAEAKIDVRVVFEDGNPFGALASGVDDQANVQQLRDAGEQIPMATPTPEPSLNMPDAAVGNIALDAITSLKRAADKSAMKDDIPF